jgi:DNA-binding HxlR family transcriptional regulator
MDAWNPYSAKCPTRFVLNRIADKWTVLVLALLAGQPMRFNAIRRQIDGLSQKVLSQVLKSLERDGLVTRSVFPTVPVTVEYAITSLGSTLATILHPITVWAEANIGPVLDAQSRYDARMQASGTPAASRADLAQLAATGAGRETD